MLFWDCNYLYVVSRSNWFCFWRRECEPRIFSPCLYLVYGYLQSCLDVYYIFFSCIYCYVVREYNCCSVCRYILCYVIDSYQKQCWTMHFSLGYPIFVCFLNFYLRDGYYILLGCDILRNCLYSLQCFHLIRFFLLFLEDDIATQYHILFWHLAYAWRLFVPQVQGYSLNQ